MESDPSCSLGETNETSEPGKAPSARRGSPVWVRDEQIKLLRVLADADGESIAFHVRHAIQAYLRGKRKQILEVRG